MEDRTSRVKSGMSPEQELKLRTATTWIPLSLVGAVVGLFVYGAWTLSNERSQIYGQIGQVSNDVKALTATVNKLADAYSKPNNLAFTRQDWIMDCLRAQIANPSWKCIYAEPGATYAKGMSQ
jgi:hypothetical protein